MLRSSAARAVVPSGQTVASWPIRGNSRRISSCNDFSSSANSSFRRLCGLAAIGRTPSAIMRRQRQADAERRAAAGAVAGGFDVAAVIGNDAIGDRQSQPDPLPAAAAGEERLEKVLQHVPASMPQPLSATVSTA